LINKIFGNGGLLATPPGMLNDFRYAFRALGHKPGFAATAIISVALAIGANAAIFSVADVVLLRPLPVRDASQVVSIRSVAPASAMSALANGGTSMSYADYVDIRDKNRSFDGLVAFHLMPAGLARDDKAQAQFRMGYGVSPNFFQVLGVEPSVGRPFSAEEGEIPGRDNVIVLAHDVWATEFGADPSVIGRGIHLNGREFVVVGIASKAFTGMDQFIRPAFFIPITIASRLRDKEDLLHDRALRTVEVKGRLKPGVTLKAANAEISAIARSLESLYPATNRGFGASVRTEIQMRLDRVPIYGFIIGSLFTLVLIILSIACCNVANLMLSRGRLRAKEVAVRLAIGAGRFRLIRQFMVESLLIGLAGGGLGLLVAQAATDYFAKIEVFSDAPVKVDYRLDERVLAFTFAASIASAILFGLIPAIRSTKTDLAPALKSCTMDYGRKRIFGRRALVVGQIAGSMVLLIAGVDTYRSSAPMLTNRGFRTDHILAMRFDTSVVGYTADRSRDFYDRLARQARALPGAKSAAFTYSIPLTSIVQQKTVIPEGYEFPKGQKNVSLMANIVDGGYFDIVGVPILRGRNFTRADRADSPHVVIVNDAFSKTYLAGDPIGKRIRLGDESGTWAEVVGLVPTGKYLSVAEPPTPYIYLPIDQNPEPRRTLLVESYGDPAALAAPVRELAHSIDPNVPLLWLRTMDDIFQRGTVQAMNMVVTTLSSASVIGFILALAGLYAVVTYQVARRTREIGIRMALGAERLQVMRMILKEAAGMGAAGIGLGLLLTYALRGVISGGQGPPQPIHAGVWVAVSAGLLLTCLLAAGVPARNASRIDPQQTLRQE
jgi:predicted permease